MSSYFAYILDLFRHRKYEIKSLNGLRALSLIGIFLHHIQQFAAHIEIDRNMFLDRVFLNFTACVDLFFILSGFLIYGILHREFLKSGKINFGQFYWKRSLRIFPAYYFFLFFLLAFGLLQIHNLESIVILNPEKQINLDNAIALTGRLKWDFLYLSNYIPSTASNTWTLSVEEQFYLLLPLTLFVLIFRLKERARWIALLVLYFIPLISRIIVISWDLPNGNFFKEYIYHAFHTRVDSLLVGILIYEFSNALKTRNIEIKKNHYALILASGCLMLFLCLVDNWMEDIPFLINGFKYNLINIGFGLLMISALDGGPTLYRKLLAWRGFVPIARLSYGMYLWHMLVGAGALGDAMIDPGKVNWTYLLQNSLIAFFLSVLIAFISYAFVEAPFIMLKNKLSKLPKAQQS